MRQQLDECPNPELHPKTTTADDRLIASRDTVQFVEFVLEVGLSLEGNRFRGHIVRAGCCVFEARAIVTTLRLRNDDDETFPTRHWRV